MSFVSPQPKVHPSRSSMSSPSILAPILVPLIPLVRSIGEHKWESAQEYLERNPTILEIEVDHHKQWNPGFTAVQREIRYILARTKKGYERKVIHI